MLKEPQMETLHVFVVPEDKLPPKPDYAGIAISLLCSLLLVGIVVLVLVSPKTEPVVSFPVVIPGYILVPASKTLHITIAATGKGHVNATYATGTITFYNGQTYTQIIPVGTVLKGSDGVNVITDEQAVIPPAAQTTPPTYGQVSVSAHALQAGTIGNIAAGDINEPCCVTSVIAQNPYAFTGGKNARDFIYLTKQDVSYGITENIQQLELSTQTSFPTSIVLEPHCTTFNKVTPAIGTETTTALLTLTTSCTAISYSTTLLKNRIEEAGKRFGTLQKVQFSIVGITQKNGIVILRLYVTAVATPKLRIPYR